MPIIEPVPVTPKKPNKCVKDANNRLDPASRSRDPHELFGLDISHDEIPFIEHPKKNPSRTKVFISYSHRDKKYLNRVLIHLKPLERQGLINTWVDTRLLAGARWREEINEELSQSRVAILLVSADFLSSDFVINNELPSLLSLSEENGAIIIPMILKPCRFARDSSLSCFYSINAPDEPLSIMNENERENTYDILAQRIEQAMQ